MKSMSSIFPLVLIVAGCSQHTRTQVILEPRTIPDSYVISFLVRDPLATSRGTFFVSMDLPRDRNHMILGRHRAKEQARKTHEFYGSGLMDFNVELVDYRFDSPNSVIGQLNIQRQYPYRAHWSLPFCFTEGTTVKHMLEAPYQKPVTIEFSLERKAEVAAYRDAADTRS